MEELGDNIQVMMPHMQATYAKSSGERPIQTPGLSPQPIIGLHVELPRWGLEKVWVPRP